MLPLRVWVHCPRASNGLLPPRSYLPSSRTPLLGPSPLRTVLKTFAIYGSSPSNALLGKTRLRNGKMEAMNLVAALWLKKHAVRSAFRATHHQRKAVVKLEGPQLCSQNRLIGCATGAQGLILHKLASSPTRVRVSLPAA